MRAASASTAATADRHVLGSLSRAWSWSSSFSIGGNARDSTREYDINRSTIDFSFLVERARA